MKTIAPGFDLRSLRCTAEADLRAVIEKDEDFHKRLMERAPQEKSVVDGRMALIQNDYRVDPAITPELDALRTRIRTTLRLVQPIDMYVRAEREPNAFCAPTKKGTRLVMCLHSALLELLTPEELLFVMGHEIGHALLEHTKMPHLDFDDQDFSPLEVVRSRALGRRQEVSCDRIGLMACQDVAVAGSALFEIMSGIPNKWLKFDASAFAKQFEEMADLAEVLEMDDVSSTHPKMALRAKALIDFSESQLYADALGGGAAKTSREDMEKATSYLLSVLEPDLTEIESASEKDAVNRYLISGAMVVIAADGHLQPEELAYFEAHAQVTDEMKAAMRQPDFVTKTLESMKQDAWILSKKLSLPNRVGVLRELCRVALAAGGYGDKEVWALSQFGQAMEIPEEAFDKTLKSESEEAPPAGAGPAVAKPTKRRRRPKADVQQPEGGT